MPDMEFVTLARSVVAEKRLAETSDIATYNFSQVALILAPEIARVYYYEVPERQAQSLEGLFCVRRKLL